MTVTVETTDGNIPLGSLESPSRVGPDTMIIKVPTQGNRWFNLARRLFNYAACLAFLPITLLGRAVEALVHLKERLTMRSSSLEGKVVLITGASSGLGEAMARCFYKEGCRLIIAARRYSELERVRDQLMGSSYRTAGPGNTGSSGIVYPPVIIQLDVENSALITEKVRTILGVYGHVDILVNNAGISFRGDAASTKLDVDAKLMAVNYFGTITLTKALLPSMLERKTGHIVMIGSVQSKLALPFRSAYAASKHALQAFSDSLRAEVKKDDVHVTVINPGYIRTSLSVNALTGDGRKYGRTDETTETGADPYAAAEKIVRAVKHQREELMLCSLFYQIVVILRAVWPRAYFLAMERRAARARKQE